jgi:hypothetical protein
MQFRVATSSEVLMTAAPARTPNQAPRAKAPGRAGTPRARWHKKNHLFPSKGAGATLRGLTGSRSSPPRTSVTLFASLAVLLVHTSGQLYAAEPRPDEPAPRTRTPEPEPNPVPVLVDEPTPLAVDYAQYGVALSGELLFDPGPLCPDQATTPCILESGAGPVLRGGYRPSGPWYIGGAYQFAKLESNNLLRLGILQSLFAEGRYYFDVGVLITPYITWALGGVIYGNEFSAQTAGAMTYVGGGFEFELSRFAVIGVTAAYQPVVFAAFEDTTGQERDAGFAQFAKLSFVVELRSEVERE